MPGQVDHHLFDHGQRFSDVARKHGRDPLLFTGNFNIPLMRTRGELEWFDRQGRKRGCRNCLRETSSHWHTLVPGESVLCQSCGDWFRRKGEFRPVDMPVRGRELPRALKAVKKAPCHNCGLRPGRYVHWRRGPGREILCKHCDRECKKQTPPRLVPRVCANPECESERNGLWVKGECGACYHYARKNGGEQRPRSVVEQ